MNGKLYFRNILLLSSVFLLLCEAHAEFEKPPTFQASQVLKPELLKSELYHVAPTVVNDGYMNHFELESSFGKFSARGVPTLEKRIHELYALNTLEKEFPSSEVTTDAVATTAKGIVTAPARGVEKLVDTVSDGDKLEKTVKSIPGGVVGLFSAAANAVKDGAVYAYETGSAVASGDQELSSAQMDKLGDTVNHAAGKYSGYSKARREVSQALQIDPFTDNETLQGEIRRVAGIQTGVAIGGRLAPAMAGVPFVGAANRILDRAGKVAAYDDPKKVEEVNQQIASTLGLTEGSSSESFKHFSKSPAYTPVTRRVILKNLERMQGVKDIELFVAMAARVKSREAALIYVSASESLADYHEQEEKLAALVSEVVVPAGVSVSGELVVPLPVDHLVWTKDVATIFNDFEKRVTAYPIKRSEIRIAGTASQRTLEEFKRFGAEEVKQNVGYY